MAKTKLQKEEDLQELVERFKTAKSAVFTEYRGTTVKDIDKFRRSLGKENIHSKVYKITLVQKALASNGVDASGLDFKTPVIVSFSEEEETAPARMVKALSGEIKTLQVLSGYLDGSITSREQVLALADLPSKQDLRGQVVRTINAPVSGFVNVLAGNLRGLVNVLNAMAQKAE